MLKDIKLCASIIMTMCQHTEMWEPVLQLVNMLVCFYLFPISINFLRAISHHAACWLLRLSHCQCNCQKWNNWNVSIFIIPINIFLDFYDTCRVWCIILIETLCKQMSTTYAPMCIMLISLFISQAVGRHAPLCVSFCVSWHFRGVKCFMHFYRCFHFFPVLLRLHLGLLLPPLAHFS